MPAFDGGDDFVGIGDPFEGFGIGVVVVEEAVDGGLEVGDRSEDAAFQATLGENREEALDGVEPGGRGRCEVEGPARIAREPPAHGRMLVGSVIVENGVDGLAGRNLALDRVEETDELLMPMALHVAADHGSVEDIHGGEQRRRAVPLVIMGHRSGAAFLHRQPGLRAVERLNLALFIDGQDDRVCRRIDIQTDHVAQLVDEFGIPGELELANAMRLQPVGAPDALDRTDTDARGHSHRRARPVRRFSRRRFDRQRDHAFGDGRIELGNARRSGLVPQKALKAFNGEALLPAPHASLGLAGLAHDGVRADALRAEQDDLRPPDMLLRRVAVFHQGAKPIHVGRSDGKANARCISQTRTPTVGGESQPGVNRQISSTSSSA